MATGPPFFSVIVPTFNRASLCASAVRSVLAQETNAAYEVIVVDNNSTDETATRIQTLAATAGDRVRYVTERAQGAAAARNAGIAAARGDILVFVDDDVVAQPRWLEALAAAYRQGDDRCCVGGKILVDLPDVLPPWFNPRSSDFMSQLGYLNLGDDTIRLEYPKSLWAGNLSIRRDVLRRVGLFNAGLGLQGRHGLLGEETELCWRIQAAGGGVFYCGQAVVRHRISPKRLRKSFLRRRLYWEGRTWAVLKRDDIVRVVPLDFLRSALRVVRNSLISAVAPHCRDPRRRFEDELYFWRSLGYMYQSWFGGRA